MTTIADVSAIPLELPIRKGRESLSAAYSTAGTSFSGVLVTVTDDVGTTGYAEAPARPYVYGDTVPSLTHMCALLGERLIGRDARDVAVLRREMDVPRGVAGNLVAKAALDVAVHDLQARSVGVPVFELLGGYHPGPASVRTTWLLPMHEPGRVLDEAERAAGEGFSSFKVKVGRPDSTVDVRLIADLRRILGDATLIYADANSGYAPDLAAAVVPRMAEYGLAWIEDPCDVDLPRPVREGLARRLPIPVLGDASCFTPRDVLRELQDGVVGMVMVKLARTGYLGARAIVEICAAAGVTCVIGTQGEMDLGSVAAGHLAASHPGFFAFTELSFFTRAARSNLATPLELKGDTFDVPDSPGLGVTPAVAVTERSSTP